jgi:uncharacterized tellurite resistance protein B-like protein
MEATRDFYAGLGCLVYAVVKADDKIDDSELKGYGKSMLKAFGEWVMSTTGQRALASFEMMANKNKTVDEAYTEAMRYLTLDKSELKRFRDKILNVLKEMAAADTKLDERELEILNRFERETLDL